MSSKIPNMDPRLGLSWNYMTKSPKDNYPIYDHQDCMVRKHLTPELYEKLYNKVTANGVTLDKCIQCSVDNGGNIIGLVAGDEESYYVFKELFDAVIGEKHLGFKPTDNHPAPDLSIDALNGGLLDANYVRSCRIRTSRNIRGLCLPPAICRAERREVERVLVQALSNLEADLAGKYYALSQMSKEEEKQLTDENILFKKPTRDLMVNSGASRDWPDSRGIWHNNEKNVMMWINEEDHCRVISIQKDSDIRAAFDRFCRTIRHVECQLKEASSFEFMWSEHLGYLSTCPSNVGTGLRASVMIQLKQLAKHPKFDDIMSNLELEKKSTAEDDVYDVSNRARLMKSEREFVQLVIDGVEKLIEMEKRLEKEENIDELIPASQ